MGHEFASSLQSIRSNPVSEHAEKLLRNLYVTEKLDAHTVFHSIRVATGALALAMTSLDRKWLVPIYAGGIMHDNAKSWCTSFFTSSRAPNDEDWHHIYMHPQRGHDFMVEENSAPHGHETDWIRSAGLVLMSHSAHRKNEDNYPKIEVVEQYSRQGRLTPETPNSLLNPTVHLAYADGIDALTHKEERPYMDDRLARENIGQIEFTIQSAYILMSQRLLPISIDVVGVLEEHIHTVNTEAAKTYEEITQPKRIVIL